MDNSYTLNSQKGGLSSLIRFLEGEAIVLWVWPEDNQYNWGPKVVIHYYAHYSFVIGLILIHNWDVFFL